MSDYIRGLNRQQQLLFPERLEDYVGENDPVRVIDAYVDSLYQRPKDLTLCAFHGEFEVIQ